MTELEAPGNGLPEFERFYLNAFFKFGCLMMSDQRALNSFQQSTKDIFEIVDANDVGVLSQQLLIPRLQGIEDSSRNWSVFMVLEHLSMVNQSIMDVVRALRNDSQPMDVVNIANYKPDENVDADSIDRFSETNRRYWSFAKSHQPLHSQLKFQHPWFGPLDGHQWHCLAAVHQKIHRRQIFKILAMIGVA